MTAAALANAAQGSGPASLEAATMRRVAWRLMPFLIAAYFFSIVDRSNIGFASLQMNEDIGLSQATFGLAGGIYFVSYFLFEVPSNLALERFGASRWIARIMVSWGVIVGLSALCTGPKSLLVMRFLLGAAEAGFFPGVALYLTYWFPPSYRARILSVLIVSIPLANGLGSPVAGYLLSLDGLLGIRGWQWLFILEGVPTVQLGFLAYFWLTDRPGIARWLTPEQRDWLTGEIERGAAQHVGHGESRKPLVRVLFDRQVLFLALVSASTTAVSTALAIWQPVIMRSFGLSYIESGFANAVPYIVASVAMVLWGRRSDRRRERRWHNVIPMIGINIGFAGLLLSHTLTPSLTMLTLIMVGTYACKGPFWAMCSERLPRSAAAPALAQISAIGNLAGFFASYLIGAIRDATGSYPLALIPMMVLCVLGTIVLAAEGRTAPMDPRPG